MAKRFTDTEKWRKAWFRKLKPKLKCAWLYLCDSCDYAGIWNIDLDSLSFHVGAKITIDELLANFEVQLFDENKLFLKSFVEFQQGQLKENNPIHKHIAQILLKSGVCNPGPGPAPAPEQGVDQGPLRPRSTSNRNRNSNKNKNKNRNKNTENSSEIFQVKEAFCSAYKVAYKSDYPWDDKNYRQAKDLIKAHGLEFALELSKAFPSLKDSWLAQTGHRFDLLRQNVPKLVLSMESPAMAILNVAEAKVFEKTSAGKAAQMLEIKKGVEDNEEYRRLRLLGSKVLKEVSSESQSGFSWGSDRLADAAFNDTAE